MLTHVILGDSKIGEGDDNNISGIEEDNVYNSSREELVLVLFSDSYLELEVISVSISKSFFCPILYHLLTT